MLRSLRFRMLLFIIFVLIVTGGMAAWFASRTIIQHFEDYLKSGKNLQYADEAKAKLAALTLTQQSSKP